MPTKTQDSNKPAAVKRLPHKIYTVRGQKRVLFTLGKGHDCKLMDVPAALYEAEGDRAVDADDSYVVERGLLPRAENDQLQALLADYVAQAKRHDAIPMTVFALTTSLEAYAAA
jgi:hypothetical protein